MPDLQSLLNKFLADLYTWASPSYAVGATTGRALAQTAANANILTVTVGAADASYEVSANLLATTSTTYTIDVKVTYTDESNTARTITLNMMLASGAISNSAQLANTNGPIFMGLPMAIRCKAGTTIVVATSGTFTTITYNCEAFIKRTA